MSLSAHYTTKQLLRRLLGEYVWHHKKKILISLVCMVVAALMTAANAWMMQPLLDKVFLEKDAAMLTFIPLAVLGIGTLNALANYGHATTMRYVGQRIIADMQIKLFTHLMHSDIGMYHDQAAGRLISRFTNDINLMRAAVSNVLTGIAKESLSTVFLIGVMFYQSWELSLIALLVFPLAGWPVIRLGKRMRKISDGTQSQLANFSMQLDETFQGIRAVKAYAREEFETTRATGIINSLFRLYIKAARVQAASAPLMELFGTIAIAGVVAYGGAEVFAGRTTPGAFFSFITALLLAYRPAKVLANLNTVLQEGLAAANRYFQVLDTAPEITDTPAARLLETTDTTLRFDNVTFAYSENGGGLRGVSFDVPAGKTAALVGPSGAGKSTVINLLLRFYETQSGRITIGGQDIREVTLSSLRNAIALVSQDTVLFDDTVAANIRYGKLDATAEEITHAARLAHADEFIRTLPQGYDTLIGPQGVRLSGGQKQRITIARALLKNAPILLLDEATSALDTASETAVQEALQVLMQNRTTLVIAHRLSTVRNADILFVMEGGNIVETGTHETLLAQGGLYHALYNTDHL